MGSQESMQEIRDAVQAKMHQHDFFVPWFLGNFFPEKKHRESLDLFLLGDFFLLILPW